MAVLLFLATRTRPVSAATIARECSLPRSSTYHLLNAMRVRHFVAYVPEARAWGLGIAAFELGSAYLRADPLEWLSRPMLAALAAHTGATAHLAVLHGNEVLYLSRHNPPGTAPPLLVTDVGVRLPAHLTSVGRAMMMRLPRAQVRAIYPPTRPLVRRTGRGPQLHSELERILRADRERGWVLEDGCVTPGVACIAAPVLAHDERPIAALNIVFLANQLSAADRGALAEQVMTAARRLSECLGFGSDLSHTRTAQRA